MVEGFHWGGEFSQLEPVGAATLQRCFVLLQSAIDCACFGIFVVAVVEGWDAQFGWFVMGCLFTTDFSPLVHPSKTK